MLAALPRSYDMVNCPFCNGRRVRVHYANRKYRVACLEYECEAQGPSRYDEQDAMDTWNSRGGLPESERAE